MCYFSPDNSSKTSSVPEPLWAKPQPTLAVLTMVQRCSITLLRHLHSIWQLSLFVMMFGCIVARLLFFLIYLLLSLLFPFLFERHWHSSPQGLLMLQWFLLLNSYICAFSYSKQTTSLLNNSKSTITAARKKKPEQLV